MIAIADIAGQYDALMRLVSKLPKKEIVLLGDLVDRGPQSKEVVEWAMTTPNVVTLLGNHEHMFIDWYRNMIEADYEPMYDSGVWFRNGGLATLRSYDCPGMRFEAAQHLPAEHILFLESLTVSFQYKEFFFSHAPWIQSKLPVPDFDRVWNREPPEKIGGKVQLFGHNSHWGLRPFCHANGPTWAMCLDQSQKNVLTAFDCDTGKLFEEPYLTGAAKTDRDIYN